MTHFLDSRIVAHYRRLVAEAGEGRDVAALYNRGDDPGPGYAPPPDMRLFAFDAADIRGLGFPYKGRRLSARDVELFAMWFARRRPEYERYWVLEYDVDFSGQWRTLFDAFAGSPADLLATTVHRYGVNPEWENWETVRTPAGRPLPSGLLRAFLPCYRISRRGIEALMGAYDNGWRGHYEATVPTILEGAGLIIEDMGGDGEFVAVGNRNRFYTNTPARNALSPGTFVFRPVRETMGAEPDRLWHPVKPPETRGGWATGRRAVLGRWAAAIGRYGALLFSAQSTKNS
ncbi:MAG: hypothetical protein M0006_07030 [Magnetospirillum sp.]|nr:hypothetical protein [Magnetospirillum sp.]